MDLTDEQKRKAKNLTLTGDSLIEVTRKVFENEELDGRCKEGRAIRKFLQSENIQYRTTKHESGPEAVKKLSEQHIQFIEDNFKEMTAIQISRTLFGPDITALNRGARLVKDYYDDLHKNNNEKTQRAYLTQPYDPPTTLPQVCELINKYASVHLNPKKLSARDKTGVECLIQAMSAPRFLTIIRRFIDLEDQRIFESQFIVHAWDKPDLTSEEIALYINVCQDYVLQLRAYQHLEKLSRMFDLMADDDNTTVAMAQTIKEKNEEYDKISKRIKDLIEKLNGKRADRLNKQQNRSVSILPLIQEFQDEESRQRMIMIADMQRQAAQEETDRIESLSDFQARVLGIGKQDVL